MTELMDERIDAGVREVTEKTARELEEAGAEVGEVELPHAYYALEAYYIIAPPRYLPIWPVSMGYATGRGFRRKGFTRCTARPGRKGSGTR